ncbi:hypothetical protein PUMCH_003029 [Australozyma saopauloensis]|uniref:Cytochrome c oxidase subunit 12, mitochondrial n=1 Tax=Australozyma saopauloensis TaxID=291208 RepID=A0AAX4HBD0_9ASCO|nr:hypothetical protein PUMCH_003029 [[Candida] saopauloensis]
MSGTEAAANSTYSFRDHTTGKPTTTYSSAMSSPFDIKTFKFDTPQFDPRFPHVNQTKHCAQNYVDYHKCVAVKGEDFEPCQIFWKTFTSLCPVDWVERWDDQREAGKFPVKIE